MIENSQCAVLDQHETPDGATEPQTSCSFPLPLHLSSGRHPDHHQPAAQNSAAVRAASEEARLQWHVVLPQAQQDDSHLVASVLHLILNLEFRRWSRQNPVTLEGLVKTWQRSAVWQVKDTKLCNYLLSAEEEEVPGGEDGGKSHVNLPVHHVWCKRAIKNT